MIISVRKKTKDEMSHFNYTVFYFLYLDITVEHYINLQAVLERTF